MSNKSTAHARRVDNNCLIRVRAMMLPAVGNGVSEPDPPPFLNTSPPTVPPQVLGKRNKNYRSGLSGTMVRGMVLCVFRYYGMRYEHRTIL